MLGNCSMLPKSSCIKRGAWENDGNALGCSFSRDPGQIEPATVFLSRLGVHALCLEQLYGCTDVLYNSTFVHCTLYTRILVPAWPRWRILTNESTSRITFMNRVDQSQGLESARTDRVGDIMKASVPNEKSCQVLLSFLL
jgi:hypothetical protein